MNFFLHTNNTDVLKALKDLPIEHPSMEIEGKEGMVVTQPNKTKVGTFLGEFLERFDKLENVEISWIGHTKYEGIDEVYITAGKHKKVTVKDWNGSGESRFKEITEAILSPVVKTTININVPHGRKSALKKRGFNINFWSSPAGSNDQTCPSTIWGYKVDCKDAVFPPSYQGIVIYDGLYPVAELIDNNLYIHHDLCHYGSDNELNIYKKLLTKVIEEFNISSEEREEKRKQKLSENKERYVDLCLKRIKKDRENVGSNISSAKNDIESYKKSMIDKLRKIEEYELLLNNYNEALEKKKETYRIEFDKLLEVDKVVGLDVSSKGIEVFTDTLYCEDPRSKKIHEIGKFRISIPIGTGSIRWHNLTRRIQGHSSSMHAPHIFKEGNACLGNAEQVLPGLIANYQFSIIAMYAIQFVESVNVGDCAGACITAWPVAKLYKSKEK